MTEKKKTHYRKAFDSPYLSSADIVEPTVLTVSHVRLEKDKSKKTKDSFNTAYFVEKEIRPGEPLKPMILNAGNSKIMKHLCDSPFIDDWINTKITVYVEHGVRLGREIVDGLRVSPEPPKDRVSLKVGTNAFNHAVAAYKRDGNLDKVKARVNVPQDVEMAIINAAKEPANAD